MSGILYGNFCVNQLSVIFSCYSILFIITRILFEEKSEAKEAEKKQNGKIAIKDIITIAAMIIVIAAIMWGAIYWIINKKNLFGAAFLLLFSFSYCGLVIGVAVFDFIKYIFLKPSNFKLTKEHEDTLWIIGLFTYFVCYAIEIEGLGKDVENYLSALLSYQSDVVKVIMLIFWYFSIILFTMTFLILFAHKLIVISKKCRKITNNKVSNQKQMKKKNEWNRISERIWNRIEKIPTAKKWKRCSYYLRWLLMLMVDIVIAYILAFAKVLKDLLWIVIIGIPRKLWKYIKHGFDMLEKDQGKVIIISSRIALVSSLLIVFCVDKYQGIFSTEGSEVYEFMCSVILIPFLITQIGALKERG